MGRETVRACARARTGHTPAPGPRPASHSTASSVRPWGLNYSCDSLSACRPPWGGHTDVVSFTRISSRPISLSIPRPARLGSRALGSLRAFRVSASRPTSRVHRRNTRLHGAGTNRANESLDRFPERSLFAWRDALRNADRDPSVHGIRSDGTGALPHRKDRHPHARG